MGWLADVVCQDRQSLGLKQRELERAAGIPYGYINMIESGKRTSIGQKTAEKLARVTGKSPDRYRVQGGDKSVFTPRRLSGIIPQILQSVDITAYRPVYNRLPEGAKSMPIDHVAVSIEKPVPETVKGYRVDELVFPGMVAEGDTILVDTAAKPGPNDLVVVTTGGKPKLEKYKSGTVYGVVLGAYKTFHK
jgi:transcriptional regulator with XRE-family HTH domain